MEEIKFVSLFPSLNKNNLNTQNKIFKNNLIKKRIPINYLLIKDYSISKKKIETDFLKNRIKFFSPNITSNNKNNKNEHYVTDFNYPLNKKKKKKNNKLFKNVFSKNNPLYEEKKPIIYKIFEQFDEINRKYNEQTKYYEHFIKTGENNRKININRNSNNMIRYPLLPKNNTKKHCSSVYQRIKSIE